MIKTLKLLIKHLLFNLATDLASMKNLVVNSNIYIIITKNFLYILVNRYYSYYI